MVNLSTLIQFISINPSNEDISTIEKINDDVVFIFDIDDTLYKTSKTMHHDDMIAWFKAYNHFKKSTPEVPKFYDLISSCNMYSGAFYKFFKKTPIEIEQVRDFSYSIYIEEDKELQNLFKGFPYKLWCFTNATKSRSEQILEKLGVINMFSGVICKDDNCPYNIIVGKPERQAYEFVEKVLNIKNKKNVYFFDDKKKNVDMGNEMGWNSFLVEKDVNVIDIVKNILKQDFN